MVHSPDECAQDPKDAFNLTGMGKLKLLVDIPVVGNIPPPVHPHVDGSPIGIDPCLGCHVGLEEIPRMFSSRCRVGENLVGKLLASYLFPHEQRTSLPAAEI